MIDPVTTGNDRYSCRICIKNSSSTFVPITESIIIGMLNSLLVQCSRCGEKTINRGDFSHHEINSCQKAVVSCKSADIKCPWKGPRESLNEHLEECVFHPLRPALSEIIKENKEYQERITKLENLVKQLQQK